MGILLLLSLAINAQKPVVRPVKGDTVIRKAEVAITEKDQRSRKGQSGQEDKSSALKEFNKLISEADKENGFNKKRELLLRARSICMDQLKNDCEKLIAEKLANAYGQEIDRLLGLASESSSYNDKMAWLDQARFLSDASFTTSNDRNKVKKAYQKLYQSFLDAAMNAAESFSKRINYLRTAERFCMDYRAVLETDDCSSAVASYAQRMFNDALSRKEYASARDICSEFSAVSNCEQAIYQAQYDQLVNEALSGNNFDRQKAQLEQARELCNRYLQNGCARSINTHLRHVYSNELNRLLNEAARSRDLRSQLQVFAEAEALCGEAYSPEDCQARINEKRGQAFHFSFDELMEDITRSNDYEEQKEMLKEAERLIAKGQLPKERWEEIGRLKKQIHYNQLQKLLQYRSGSIEEQLRYLEQAQEINQNFLQYAYNQSIQERRTYLVTQQVYALLRTGNDRFSEKIQKLDQAQQLIQQLDQRSRFKLAQEIGKERREVVVREYDDLVYAAREERYLDKKMSKYDQAIRFCGEFPEELSASRGDCRNLQQERREVVVDVYRNMLSNAQSEIQAEQFDKALSILSKAEGVYKLYSNDLTSEMPVSAAYQQLYNQFLSTAKSYARQRNYDKARALLQEAGQLEGQRYWVVAAANSVDSQLEEIDRMEMDDKLQQLERLQNESSQIAGSLALLKTTNQLFSQKRKAFTEQQANRLRLVSAALVRSGMQLNRQYLSAARFEDARALLNELQSMAAGKETDLISATLVNELRKTFSEYYQLQLDQTAQQISIDLPAATRQLDRLYAQLQEDQAIKGLEMQEDRMMGQYRRIFEKYQDEILKQLSQANFNTAALENELDRFYQTHQFVFSKKEYQSAQKGMAFAKKVEQAKWKDRQQAYVESLDLWIEAINLVDFAPASYRRPGLLAELNQKRNTAYAAEVDQRMAQLRSSTYEQARIEGYRAMQAFIEEHQLPLSAYALDEKRRLKDDIFGDICVERNEQYYIKMELGDRAVGNMDYTSALQYFRQALEVAQEFPECGVDLSRVQRKIGEYEVAAAFQQRKAELERLEEKVHSGTQESNFRAYQDAYTSLNAFYLDNIINKGYGLNLVPYQRKILQIRNNDFLSFVVWSNCTKLTELNFTNSLLRQLVEDNSLPAFKLEALAEKMAEENYRAFGGKNYKTSFERYEMEELKRDKRFRKFKKAYKKHYKKIS